MQLIADILAFVFGISLIYVIAFKYERWSLALVMLAFFWAGMAMPLQGFWLQARWVVLSIATIRGIAGLVKNQPPLTFGMMHFLPLLQAIILVVSYVNSVNPFLTLLKGLTVLVMMVYVLTGARAILVREEVEIRRVMIGFAELFAYVTAASYGVFQHRLYGNPNALGAFTGVLVWPILFSDAFSKKPLLSVKRRYAALALCGYFLMQSMSRASILGAAVASMFIMLCDRRRVVQIVRIMLFAMPFAVLNHYYPEYGQNLIETYIYKGHEVVLKSRESYWAKSWDYIKEKPWFGYGFGVDPGSYGQWEFGYESGEGDRERGSSLLALLEGVGFLGGSPILVFLLALLFRLWRTAARHRQSDGGLSLSAVLGSILLGATAHSLFEGWLLATGFYLCIFFWSLVFIYYDLETRKPRPMRLDTGAASEA